MHTIARVLKSALKAALFFTLFAFALNNQANGTVYFFFGHEWTAPMVLIVFTAFAAGLIIGVLGTVPRWWRRRNDLGQPAQAAVNSLSTPADRPSTESTLPPPGI